MHAVASFKIVGVNKYKAQKELDEHLRGLVQSPCGKISVIMTLGGEGVLVHDVMQLHC